MNVDNSHQTASAGFIFESHLAQFGNLCVAHFYFIQEIFTCRTFSQISGNSQHSQKFPARENLLFYSSIG